MVLSDYSCGLVNIFFRFSENFGFEFFPARIAKIRNMTGICALIPARAGSKGVPDKNIRLLAGQPLLAWSVRAAVLASAAQRVIISTDSTRYADIARQHGAEVPFLRPEQAASDLAGDEDVVRHLLDYLSQSNEPVPDLIIYLRPTTPLRDPEVINKAVQVLTANPAATSLRSVHQMSESAYKSFECRDGQLFSVGSDSPALDAASGPRQGFPDTWVGNGYVDVFRSHRLLEGLPLYGDKVAAFETSVASEVDTEDDFAWLEYLAERHADVYNQLFNNNNI